MSYGAKAVAGVVASVVICLSFGVMRFGPDLTFATFSPQGLGSNSGVQEHGGEFKSKGLQPRADAAPGNAVPDVAPPEDVLGVSPVVSVEQVSMGGPVARHFTSAELNGFVIPDDPLTWPAPVEDMAYSQITLPRPEDPNSWPLPNVELPPESSVLSVDPDVEFTWPQVGQDINKLSESALRVQPDDPVSWREMAVTPYPPGSQALSVRPDDPSSWPR